jgi:hypothetical protein
MQLIWVRSQALFLKIRNSTCGKLARRARNKVLRLWVPAFAGTTSEWISAAADFFRENR